MTSMCLSLIMAFAGLLFQQTPARDAPVALATGTAVIRGVVVNNDVAHRPVRLARVALGGLPGGRIAITDDAGRFVFANLPAGNYTVSVSKPAYLPSAYGATRLGRAGTTIVLADKQAADVSIALTLGGVISGVIRDGRGRPIAGVDVGAIPAPTPETPRPSFTAAPASTDDRGEFRLFGVPPGQYYVAAVLSNFSSSAVAGRRSVEENDALFALLTQRSADGAVAAPGAVPKKLDPLPPAPAAGVAPVFYPGTLRLESASVITVASGVERQGVDFVMSPVRAASIDGTVQGPVSKLDRVELSLIVEGPQFPTFSSSRPILTARPDLQGHFRYDNMPPGRYAILARAIAGDGDPAVPAQNQGSGFSTSASGTGSFTPPSGSPEGQEFIYARAAVEVDGASVEGIVMTLTPGVVATGTVTWDRTVATIPADVTGIRIRFGNVQQTSMSVSNNTAIGNNFLAGPSTAVRADGSWVARGIPPSSFTVQAALPATISKEWWLRSAMFNGRDLLDGPVDVTAGQDLSGIIFTFTDRHSELSGTLTTETGKAASDYFIIVCPAESSLWTAGSRRVKSLRPSSDGSFSVKDLLAGEYVIAALTDVAPGEWNDPHWLAGVAPAGLKITITDGEKTVQNLRVGGSH